MNDMHGVITAEFAFAGLNGWEVAAIVTVVAIIVFGKGLPGLAAGLARGISEFDDALGNQAHHLGRNVGGIFGKTASEAITPENEVAELYKPGAFEKRQRTWLERVTRWWKRLVLWIRKSKR